MKVLVALSLVLLAACTAPLTEDAAQHPDAAAYAQNNHISIEEASRRLNQQASVGPMQERLNADPNFAGLYIEHDPHQVVVFFTGADPAAQLRRYTSDPYYVARTANVTRAQLERTQIELNAALDRANIYYMGSGTDTRTNEVMIEVVSADAFRRDAARAGIALPPYVRLVERGGVIAEAQRLGPITSFPQAIYPAGAEMQALARGRLVVVNGCVRLVGENQESGPLVIWPSSALLERSGEEIRIRDRVSGNVAALGDVVEMGGGNGDTLSPRYMTGAVPAACAGPYWFAGTGWRRACANRF